MLNIVLYEPEIPPNTGNIIRLSANIGANLHLIKPYGFEFNNKKLRRAGLDYKKLVNLYEYDNFSDFINTFKPKRIFAVSTKGKTNYTNISYQKNDVFLFGPETRGLAQDIIDKYTSIYLPMKKDNRSLNLSNCVAIVLYEAWRQIGFIK